QIVVKEDGAPGDPVIARLGHHVAVDAGGGSHVGKRPTIIVQQEGAADVGIEIVEPTVAVVVAHGYAHAVTAIGRADTRSHISEGSCARLSELIFEEDVFVAVRQVEVEVAIVIEVGHRHARAVMRGVSHAYGSGYIDKDAVTIVTPEMIRPNAIGHIEVK